jgi:hypothetical protein
MNDKHLIGALLTLVVASTACVEEEVAEDTQDATETIGVQLKSSEGLKAKIRLLDGVQSSTKNQRFIKVTMERGNKKFDFFCGLSGELQLETRSAFVSCTEGTTEISNTKSEKLTFDIALNDAEGERLFQIGNYRYSGGARHREVDALMNPDGDLDDAWLSLSVEKRSSTVTRDVFKLSDRIQTAIDTYLNGAIFETPDGPTVFSIAESATYSLSNTMEISVHYVGEGIDEELELSVLKTPGKLSSGILSQKDLEMRIEQDLPLSSD